MSKGLRYVGGGFFHGVPARDLTGEEADRYGRYILLTSQLYVEADAVDAVDAEEAPVKGKPKPAENKSAAGPQENK